MGERDEGVVVGLGAGAADVRLGVDLGDRAEEDQGLVDDVAAEVVEQTSDLCRVAGLAPAALELRAPALEAGLEAPGVAEFTVGEEPPEGQEVVVPAAVLEDGEEQAALLGEGGQLAGLGRGAGDRLVHDHRQARLEGGRGQRDVGLVRGGDDDQVQLVRAVEQLFGGGGDSHVRELGAGLLLPLRVGGDHGVQGEALGGGDQRGVEDRAGEAVADQTDAEGGSSHASHFGNAVAEVQAVRTMGM